MPAINEELDHKKMHFLQARSITQLLTQQMAVMEDEGRMEIDHRLLARKKRTKYDHDRALYCINTDYLDDVPRFNGREFETMFRLSRTRFQRLMEDFAACGDGFYTDFADCTDTVGASLEARLLLPLKSMAYGVPPHTFRDYFQMSPTLAKTCTYKFYEMLPKIYQFEYLRMPTSEDLRNVTRLHAQVHGVNGMFGSLDCMHTWWKNCPVAWKGSYKGKEKRSTIVLEAACDHHLWFWHTAYGYAGTLNDINILNMSPLMDRILDGTFQELEKAVTPFKIGDEDFHSLYMLVDGIYPKYNRFVKAVLEPRNHERKFTKWQEAARKDIERAFGVLQCRWQCVARPIYLMELKHIRNMVTSALILHNMGVSDRVMEGDVHARYNPAHSLVDDMDSLLVLYPHDRAHRQQRSNSSNSRVVSCVTSCNRDRDVYNLVAKDNRFLTPDDPGSEARWESLRSEAEHFRLQSALMRLEAN